MIRVFNVTVHSLCGFPAVSLKRTLQAASGFGFTFGGRETHCILQRTWAGVQAAGKRNAIMYE